MPNAIEKERYTHKSKKSSQNNKYVLNQHNWQNLSNTLGELESVMDQKNISTYKELIELIRRS